jgi:hypothetical protein
MAEVLEKLRARLTLQIDGWNQAQLIAAQSDLHDKRGELHEI